MDRLINQNMQGVPSLLPQPTSHAGLHTDIINLHINVDKLDISSGLVGKLNKFNKRIDRRPFIH